MAALPISKVPRLFLLVLSHGLGLTTHSLKGGAQTPYGVQEALTPIAGYGCTGSKEFVTQKTRK